MLAVAGIAFEVDEDKAGPAKQKVEDLLKIVLQNAGQLDGEPVPVKVWVAAHDNTEVRDAEFVYKDQRCRFDPEYGFTHQGKKLMEKHMEEAAHAAAAQAEQRDD